jgi:hypothetical protein
MPCDQPGATTLSFALEADDAVLATLDALCRLSVAVTLRLRDGEVVGATLLAVSHACLVVEPWDPDGHEPSGTPRVIALYDVAALLVT